MSGMSRIRQISKERSFYAQKVDRAGANGVLILRPIQPFGWLFLLPTFAAFANAFKNTAAFSIVTIILINVMPSVTIRTFLIRRCCSMSVWCITEYRTMCSI